VIASVMMFIDKSKFAPAIADVKENIEQLDRLLNNGHLKARAYMGNCSYDKLPIKTRQYIEKIEAARLPEPEPKKIKLTTDDEQAADFYINKMAALFNDKNLNKQLEAIRIRGKENEPL
jgi:hypothetical protein